MFRTWSCHKQYFPSFKALEQQLRVCSRVSRLEPSHLLRPEMIFFFFKASTVFFCILHIMIGLFLGRRLCWWKQDLHLPETCNAEAEQFDHLPVSSGPVICNWRKCKRLSAFWNGQVMRPCVLNKTWSLVGMSRISLCSMELNLVTSFFSDLFKLSYLIYSQH